MKTLQNILQVIAGCVLIVIGLVSLAFITYAIVQRPPATTVVVLRDVTDTFDAQPDVGELLELFDRSVAGRWNGAHFYASTVTDVSYNRVSEAHLPPASRWLSNELQRDIDVKQFQADVSSIVAVVSADTVGRPHSSVYQAIALQLERLSEEISEKKVLVVYSDLMENSPDLSMYEKATFNALQTNPDSIAAVLAQQQPLPSLTGIEVYLIHQPLDAVTDKQFRVVSGFYRDLLQSKGATVHVSANLN